MRNKLLHAAIGLYAYVAKNDQESKVRRAFNAFMLLPQCFQMFDVKLIDSCMT